jgi:hypothetical protein
MLMEMFAKRRRGSRAIGDARDEVSLGLWEAEDEAVIVYDEEVLRGLEEQKP